MIFISQCSITFVCKRLLISIPAWISSARVIPSMILSKSSLAKNDLFRLMKEPIDDGSPSRARRDVKY